MSAKWGYIMINVLFVCMGNICRSPMAEAVFAKMVKEAGLESMIAVDSAGTSGWHEGEAAHAGTLRVLAANGIPYNGRSRQIAWSDFEAFDYIVCMDRENLQALKRVVNSLGNRNTNPQLLLFLQHAKAAGLVNTDEVSDPYLHGRFEDTYALVTLGARALLAAIREEHHL